MQQILIYADSLTWGIVPTTRNRLPFEQRWPGVLEGDLLKRGRRVRVLEDCLNGRRTVFEDPFDRRQVCRRRAEVRRALAGLSRRLCGSRLHLFYAGNVTTSSRVDGVHLDAEQHAALGRALADLIAPMLG